MSLSGGQTLVFAPRLYNITSCGFSSSFSAGGRWEWIILRFGVSLYTILYPFLPVGGCYTFPPIYGEEGMIVRPLASASAADASVTKKSCLKDEKEVVAVLVMTVN